MIEPGAVDGITIQDAVGGRGVGWAIAGRQLMALRIE